VTDRVSDIRIAFRDRAYLLYERLELAASDVFQVCAIGKARGGLVKIDRDFQFAPDLGAEPLGELHTLFQRDTLDRNKRNHVGRADARVRTLLLGQIDQRDGLLHRAERSIGNRGRRTGEGQHAAVMIGIGFTIQQDHLGNGEDCLYDCVNFSGIAAFRKIGDTLYELARHLLS